MILITGATGHYGKAAIEALLKQGTPKTDLAALVRDESKAADLKTWGIEIRLGDYNDYESMTKAFGGVDKLLFVSSSELQNRTEQQANVVKAAKEAGVGHIYYTSVDRKTDSEDSPMSFVLSSHLATENAIRESGLDYTILRHNLYLDLLPWFLGEKVLETGIYFPAGDGKMGFALRSEMAEAAAKILTTEGHEGKEYNISATNPVSFAEVAGMLSGITGKTVGYHSPDLQTYVDTMLGAGTPIEYAGMLGGFAEAGRQGELAAGNSDLARILGREPMAVRDFLARAYT